MQLSELTPATGAGRPPAGEPAAPSAGAAAWIALLRPRQWLKNTFVLVPLLFSGSLADVSSILAAIAAFALFCAVASGVYCWNDVMDREDDVAHPTKCRRPVAAGLIRPRDALLAGSLLIAAGATASFLLATKLGLVMIAYIGLNALYNYVLRAEVILDIFAIAGFFVLRLVAGAAAISVVPSIWLLLCGGLLALYIATSKRRQELVLLGGRGQEQRGVLQHYDIALLDHLSVVLLSVVIVAYVMYTLTSETAAATGSERLSYSTVFVLYGLFRYLYASRARTNGSDPTDTLLADKPTMLVAVAWFAYCFWVLYAG